MRLIDADSLKAKFKDPVIMAFVKETIDNEPEAIVKCKDCKHTVSFTCGGVNCRYCVVNDRDVDEHDFCSYGEKGEGE